MRAEEFLIDVGTESDLQGHAPPPIYNLRTSHSRRAGVRGRRVMTSAFVRSPRSFACSRFSRALALVVAGGAACGGELVLGEGPGDQPRDCASGTCVMNAADAAPVSDGPIESTRPDATPPVPARLPCAKRFGDKSDQFATAVGVDDAQNLIVSGFFQGTLDLGGVPLVSAGQNDLFVAKFDTACRHVFSKRFGDSENQVGSAAVDRHGNIYFASSFVGSLDFGMGPITSVGHSSAAVTKLDANGAAVWTRTFDSDPKVDTINVDSAGNVRITGRYSSPLDLGRGPLTTATAITSIFVANLSPAGTTLWSKGFGGPYDQAARSASIDGLGNLAITGLFRGSIDFGDGLLATSGKDDYDAFVAVVDPTGGHVWSKRFGDAADQVGAAVAQDAAGNVFLAGRNNGTIDLGNGALPGDGSGMTRAFLAKLTPSGAHIWSAQLTGGFSTPSSGGLAVDQAGNVLMVGDFQGTTKFGGEVLESGALFSIFAAKVSASGASL